MSKNIQVKTSQHSYSAVVGEGIFVRQIKGISDSFEGDINFLLVDENVEKYHSNIIDQAFEATGKKLFMMSVPEGEKSKSISFWNTCVEFLLENGVRRNTPVFVMGGGVTGDVGGFAAASALRGVPLIHIPTTVLAMVDSSIGGKTGVNHSTGKNLIGAFYQPQKVVADIAFLNSLPRNEWTNGLSEILKYGAIERSDIFDRAAFFLEDDISKISHEQLIDLIADCIQIKADIVEKDEFEGNIRAFLNFGHTFAHALEKACGYQSISHGEAVYLGMLAAIDLSNHLGADLKPDKLLKYRSLYRYRVSKDQLSLDDLMNHMKFDKKRTNQHIRFVLLKEWQSPILKEVASEEIIHQAWQTALQEI